MSVFGIVVEGDSDAAVYSAIIRRIRPDIERVVVRTCGGVPALHDKFVGWLKYFQYNIERIDKALVIRDSDRKDPQALETALRDRLDRSGFKPPFPVHFYATRCMVETWLLADDYASHCGAGYSARSTLKRAPRAAARIGRPTNVARVLFMISDALH